MAKGLVAGFLPVSTSEGNNGSSGTIPSASDITTGILAITNGGTGNSSGYIRTGLKAGVTVGTQATAEGKDTQAIGIQSHAEGECSIASGVSSHAEGGVLIVEEGSTSTTTKHSEAYGIASHAEGVSKAIGNYSHAEGSGVVGTTNSKDYNYYASQSNYAHAEGNNTIACGAASHAEGISTLADNTGSHAEGKNVIARGDYSHAEGCNTEVTRDYAHVEGFNTHATGIASHAEGGSDVHETRADGDYSHAEGYSTCASANYSHAEGYTSDANGEASHAEGKSRTIAKYSHAEGISSVGDYEYNEGGEGWDIKYDEEGNEIIRGIAAHAEGWSYAYGDYSHSEGCGCVVTNPDNGEAMYGSADGDWSHAEGGATTATGTGSHSEGRLTEAQGNYSHAEGNESIASGEASHAEGQGTTASGNYSHAEGYITIASGAAGHTEGSSTNASNTNAHAEGAGTVASGVNSHAEGAHTRAIGGSSHAAGHYTTANGLNYVIGHFNRTPTSGVATNDTGDAFIIGKGTSESSRTNAFRVTYAGKAMGLSSFGSSGADYAEYFEWQDGNPNEEDRVGYFVTLDDDKIRKAENGEYVLGIVSGEPCIIGNSDEDWTKRWVKDEFGRFVKEYVSTTWVESETDSEPREVTAVIDKDADRPETDAEGNKITYGWRYKENPDYDPSQPYIERQDRKEWDAIGMVGVLAVRDDGTCVPGGFCKCSKKGIATKAETGYYVISRITDSIVKVVFK